MPGEYDPRRYGPTVPTARIPATSRGLQSVPAATPTEVSARREEQNNLRWARSLRRDGGRRDNHQRHQQRRVGVVGSLSRAATPKWKAGSHEVLSSQSGLAASSSSKDRCLREDYHMIHAPCYFVPSAVTHTLGEMEMDYMYRVRVPAVELEAYIVEVINATSLLHKVFKQTAVEEELTWHEGFE